MIYVLKKKIEKKSNSYGWIKELKKDNKIRRIIGYQLDLNKVNAYTIARDKFATFSILKNNNVPTIEHRIIFNPKTRNSYYENKFINDAKKLLIENENKVIIKANISSKGKDVFFCSNESEIEETVQKLLSKNNDTLSACPYVNIEYEYRAIYLSGKIVYVYKKKKPFIVGNGINTVQELINQKFHGIDIDLCKNLNLTAIPKENEEIIISWKHNLSSGAQAILIDENDKYVEKVKEIALKAAKTIDIEFASVDIALTENKELLVMEINESVCLNIFSQTIPGGYEIAKQIYSTAIDKMFEN